MPLPTDNQEWSVDRDHPPVTGEGWPWSVTVSGVTAIHYYSRPVWRVARRIVHDEMLWAGLSGEGWIEVSGTRHALLPGHLIHVGRGQFHACGCGQSGVELIGIHYTAAVAGIPLHVLIPVPTTAQWPVDGPWYGRLHELCRWHARGGALASTTMAGLMATILAELIPSGTVPAAPSAGLHRLLPALIAMRNHLHLAPRLDVLAAACGLSSAQFRRCFHACLGHSPQEHRQHLRLEAARALLRTNTPLAKVAESIGYQEPATFSRVFKAATGVSPGRWRAIAAQGP